eukprot:CAMPEP_0118676242 /NCGR_PEP_ID=MMETSP0800-20121206/1931_1 /TAXON_ID=210618 ORGANISM="Striatella unipunctata, Strain CCMP2910" /NCGR_SAMPLE_ID=MMETSP0800 /ASSEMBLY_ACC=CAM_ASM_000638 /LENGTH=310 /DNA_ID=CAMNT_0006571719 /DNA_START=8 /DNA_END=940 /DNA_ORIENTATION=+
MGAPHPKDDIFTIEARVARADCPRPEKCFQCKHKRHPGKHLMICYPKKCVKKARKFFEFRPYLHSEVYTHKNAKAADIDVMNMLQMADPYYPIKTSTPGKILPISKAMNDPSAYLQLTDSILDQIKVYAQHKEWDGSEKFLEAHERYSARKLTKFVYEVSTDEHPISTELRWNEEEKQEITNGVLKECYEEIDPSSITIEFLNIHQGRGKDDPVKFMRFVDRSECKSARAGQILEATQFPGNRNGPFQERRIRLFTRHSKDIDKLKDAFRRWFDSSAKFNSAVSSFDEVDMGPFQVTQDSELDDDDETSY